MTVLMPFEVSQLLATLEQKAIGGYVHAAVTSADITGEREVHPSVEIANVIGVSELHVPESQEAKALVLMFGKEPALSINELKQILAKYQESHLTVGYVVKDQESLRLVPVFGITPGVAPDGREAVYLSSMMASKIGYLGSNGKPAQYYK
ncbi:MULTISPECIES: hypothetical protein [Lactobacillaceae]|uniref:hypothetical protein n=1 Tax=Lactobacillaceae TaxID=33958 RepID=UPI0005B48892|nr:MULTISPECIES: hypothetical protein [Lactobacillaceae]ARO02240.1 hypothetical protein BIZ31_14935 [Lactiplantibacillus plantarum]ARO05186.1 hypothetical protein BIZ32_14965 [Lactiplantibacillus plantarum]KIO93699.1 hypothetical protein N624_2767 [Levilactobacillus brevis]